MALILTIENDESLPNGVPLRKTLGRKGGLDIGRGANQDWVLPDPSRFISSRHCEVRYRDNAYWLYDISANGTFLEKSASRLQAPHKLSDGDRFVIGTYIIAAAIEPDEDAAAGHVGHDWTDEEQKLEARPADGEPTSPGGPTVVDEPGPTPGLEPEQVLVVHEPDRPAAPPESNSEAPHEPRHESALDGHEFLRRFAAGAGVPEQIFARRDSLELAEELGQLLRLTAENLTQLLRARADIGRTAGVSSQTTVQALDNNPLKFTPGTEDALRIMFGPRTRGFLDARRAIEGAFNDLKAHQVYTFAAMQQAVRMLVEDFDPKAIDAAAGPDHGLTNLLGSRKARLWDMYVARWQAQTLRHDDGLAGAFMRYFGQCFDQAKDAKFH